VSGDALHLYTASGGEEGIEAISPITLITVPKDPSKYEWRLQDPNRKEPVLGRLSVCRSNRIDTLHFVNVDALNRASNGIVAAVLEAAGRLQPLPLRAGEEFTNRVLSGSFTNEAESCIAHVLSRHEYIVYESNSDIAIPAPSALGADWVIIVANGAVGVVSGDRWAKAVEVLAGTGGLRSITVKEVVALTGIREAFQLPFLYEPLEGYKERDLNPLLSYITRGED
jgi:predicted P-loop ATPase/GTPase